MEKEKNYSNLRLKLVLKYYWEVIRRYKVSFFTVLILTIFYSVLDVYIPLQYLKLWDILSTNDFTVVEAAKFIIIFILFLHYIQKHLLEQLESLCHPIYILSG